MTDKKNILIVVQARTGSTRLPGKTLMPILGKTVLYRMMERLKQIQHPVQLVIATSTEVADNAIETEAENIGVPCFRGSLTNLLDRHYQAGRFYHADVVIKIPSDCPLIDPRIVDEVIRFYLAPSMPLSPKAVKENTLKNSDGPLNIEGSGLVTPSGDGGFDFVSNLHPASWPDGNDVELMTMACLEKTWQEAKRPMELEHTTPYIWENPDKFRMANLEMKGGKDLSKSYRFTIDYIEDYEFIKTVFEELYPTNPTFSCDDILDLLHKRPDIYDINAKHAGEYWYRHHLDELKTVSYQP